MGGFPSKPEDQQTLAYRDYLVQLWVDVKTNPWYRTPDGEHYKATPAQILYELKCRFHQDFESTLFLEMKVVDFLTVTLTGILRDGEQYGLNDKLPGGKIPNQGNDSKPEYLQKLINLTGLTATELSLRYDIRSFSTH